MSRGEKLRRILSILVLPVVLWVSPGRLDAFPIHTFFADVNGDGQLEEVELLFEGTQNSIAVHVSRSNIALYRFEAKISPFGSVLAGDFDHDSDLDLIWLTGAGPGSVLLHSDGQGNFQLIDNTHAYASDLRILIDNEQNASLESPRDNVVTCVCGLSDYSKGFLSAPAWSTADCILHRFCAASVEHSVRASPQYRLTGRSPPQPTLFPASFSS